MERDESNSFIKIEIIIHCMCHNRVIDYCISSCPSVQTVTSALLWQLVYLQALNNKIVSTICKDSALWIYIKLLFFHHHKAKKRTSVHLGNQPGYSYVMPSTCKHTTPAFQLKHSRVAHKVQKDAAIGEQLSCRNKWRYSNS